MKLPALLVFLLLLPGPASGALPSLFTETFLDFREDVAQAARGGRRLMILFEQDGCPYCKELILTNFSQKAIADKARKKFLAVSLNIWGDREVTWTDGKKFSEKSLAAFLKIQFTPTLVFFDERGAIVARLNGYYPPHRFEAVLDWVARRREGKSRSPSTCAPRSASLRGSSCTTNPSSSSRPTICEGAARSRSPSSSRRRPALPATSCTARAFAARQSPSR